MGLTYQWLGPAIFLLVGTGFLTLFMYDSAQKSALRLAGAYFTGALGFMLILFGKFTLVSLDYMATQLLLFTTFFLLVYGVFSLYGKLFPWLCFGLMSGVAIGLFAYAFVSSASVLFVVSIFFGFAVFCYVLCGVMVWRARNHCVDVVISLIFLGQAVLTCVRVAQMYFPNAGTLFYDVTYRSEFSVDMQTGNAIYAMMIGLALFARYSTTLLLNLHYLAETDSLTGLFNRRAFEAKVKKFQTENVPMSGGLIVCDIDHFKQVNDVYGHDVGDMVLKAVARHFISLIGGNGVCARLGGEEFCAFIPKSNVDKTKLLASSLCASLETLEVQFAGGTLHITASFGFCEMAPEDDLYGALKKADEALYQAKADGRNRVRQAVDQSLVLDQIASAG